MIPLCVFGGLFIVVIVALIFYKVKWGRAGRAEERRRSGRIEEERIEEEAKRKQKTQL
jgi:uncharacterized protein (DUF2062 family)